MSGHTGDSSGPCSRAHSPPAQPAARSNRPPPPARRNASLARRCPTAHAVGFTPALLLPAPRPNDQVRGRSRKAAEILREYGPFPNVDQIGGVTFDGQQVWFAAGGKLNALDPASGKLLRTLDVAAHAGTAFDGKHLFQIAENRIQKIDPQTGQVLATIPAPGGGGDSGLAWSEGTLWVGQHRERKIHQVDPETGVILRTIESNRFVTGVTWVDGELWHGTWEGEESDVRRIDPRTGEVLEQLDMPPGVFVSGMESDGGRSSLVEVGGAGRCGLCGGSGVGRRRGVARLVERAIRAVDEVSGAGVRCESVLESGRVCEMCAHSMFGGMGLHCDGMASS